MIEIVQNGQKQFSFIVVPLLRIENAKERWKTKEIYIQSKKNICKLKWLSP